MESSMPPLPSKKAVALDLLERTSLFVHLDPRRPGVIVPLVFAKQPQLVLQIGLNMAIAIPDLEVSDNGISCTLSFNRRPHLCRLPWSAIYALIGQEGGGMVWPEDVPPEVVSDALGFLGEHRLVHKVTGDLIELDVPARSLTLNPEIFLFDEPFGALDEITRDRMNDEVLRLFQIERFAGLFITHSISEAVYLSTRVLVMSARPGRIVAEFDVPFDYPREPDLRFEPAFAELNRTNRTITPIVRNWRLR